MPLYIHITDPICYKYILPLTFNLIFFVIDNFQFLAMVNNTRMTQSLMLAIVSLIAKSGSINFINYSSVQLFFFLQLILKKYYCQFSIVGWFFCNFYLIIFDCFDLDQKPIFSKNKYFYIVICSCYQIKSSSVCFYHSFSTQLFINVNIIGHKQEIGL